MRTTPWRWLAAALALAALLCGAPVAAQERVGVLMLHGKNPGSPDNPQYRPVKGALEREGMLVLLPDMPWSRTRYIDGDWNQAMAEVQSHVAALRAQGATRIVLLGHSMGVPAALSYAARHGDVDALVLLAPGHVPRGYYTAPSLSAVRDSIDKARRMVAEGKGDARDGFADINQGRRVTALTSARNYLSYFDPDSDAEMGVTAPRVPARIPVLTVIGHADPLFQRVREYYVDKLPANPRSRYLEVQADHLATPGVALPQVLVWIQAALAP